MSDREKMLVAALIAAILVAAATLLIATRRVHSSGRIKAIGVEVYEDPDLQFICHEIDWGMLSPGDMAGVTIYVRNVKNTAFTLSMNASNWEPVEAEQYLALGWNYSGEVLGPADVVVVQLTLSVNVDIEDVDVFSFDVWIYALEVKA